MNKKGMSLPEVLISVMIMAVFFGALYGLVSTINRSSELVRWKSEQQMEIRKFFKDYLVRDINKASYPSEINDGETVICGGSDPQPENKFRYKSSNGDGEPVTFDAETLSDGQVLMSWQINHPGVVSEVVSVDDSGDEDDLKPGFVECQVIFIKKDPDSRNRRNCLVYNRVGNISWDNELRDINSKVMVDDVSKITFSHQMMYTEEQIEQMNIVPGSQHSGNPDGTLLETLDPKHPDIFYQWMNSGTVNIEIEMRQDRILDVLFGKSDFRFSEKISIKTNVDILATSL